MKKKPKSLGQIAYEAYYRFAVRPYDWAELGKNHQQSWQREARAVEREVLRRAKKAKR